MKKILFIENELDYGGRQKISLDILTLLAESKNFQVDLCLLKEGGAWDDRVPKEINKINIFDLPIEVVRKRIEDSDNQFSLYRNVKRGKLFRASKILLNKKYRKNRTLRYGDLFCHIKQNHYDYAVIATVTTPILLAIIANVNADKKYGWIHSSFCKFKDRKKFGLKACTAINNVVHDVNLYKKLDKIICVSDFIKTLFDYYMPDLKDRTEVVYNPLNVNKVKELADEDLDLESSAEYVITTVGRISEEKGQQLAVRAASILKKDGYNFVWYFVGGGANLEKLKSFVRKKNLEKQCIFVGAKNNPYPYIKACNIYCQPSLTEAYCTTVNEARVLGKPIVATKFTGITEQIVSGKDGLICEIDAKELAKSLIKTFDERYRKSLAQSVRYPNDIEKKKLFSVERLFDES